MAFAAAAGKIFHLFPHLLKAFAQVVLKFVNKVPALSAPFMRLPSALGTRRSSLGFHPFSAFLCCLVCGCRFPLAAQVLRAHGRRGRWVDAYISLCWKAGMVSLGFLACGQFIRFRSGFVRIHSLVHSTPSPSIGSIEILFCPSRLHPSCRTCHCGKHQPLVPTQSHALNAWADHLCQPWLKPLNVEADHLCRPNLNPSPHWGADHSCQPWLNPLNVGADHLCQPDFTPSHGQNTRIAPVRPP